MKTTLLAILILSWITIRLCRSYNFQKDDNFSPSSVNDIKMLTISILIFVNHVGLELIFMVVALCIRIGMLICNHIRNVTKMVKARIKAHL